MGYQQQILDDDYILNMKKSFTERKAGLQSVSLQYQNFTNQIHIQAEGIEGIPHPEEYYENIEENLIFTNFSWLTPLANELKTNFNATIPVAPDGSFNHQNIELVVSIELPLRAQPSSFPSLIYPIFKKLVSFRQFLEFVEFKGHESHIKHINFHFKIDGKMVNPILKQDPKVNGQILQQWIATLKYVSTYVQEQKKYILKLPVINGRMSTVSFKSTMCFRFPTRRWKNEN